MRELHIVYRTRKAPIPIPEDVQLIKFYRLKSEDSPLAKNKVLSPEEEEEITLGRPTKFIPSWPPQKSSRSLSKSVAKPSEKFKKVDWPPKGKDNPGTVPVHEDDEDESQMDDESGTDNASKRRRCIRDYTPFFGRNKRNNDYENLYKIPPETQHVDVERKFITNDKAYIGRGTWHWNEEIKRKIKQIESTEPASEEEEAEEYESDSDSL